MGVTYTKQQQRVIDETGKDLLVSAAAGSGKTAVLVARILRMITDKTHPVDIDRLLIVTFTKAAADEMRERISRAIRTQLLMEPENQQLQRQATYIHKAQITTIDSFCKYLIANHFEDIGVDPSLRVTDEAETKLLMQDVMAELMEEKHAQADPDFIGCLECYASGKTEAAFEEQIFRLHRFAMSYPWPREWLEGCMDIYTCETAEELLQTGLMWELLAEAHMQAGESCRLLQEALAVCEEPDGPYMYGELLEGELARACLLADCRTYQDYEKTLSELSFDRLPSKKDASVSLEKRERAKQLRAQAKELLSHLREAYFALPIEQVFRDIKGCECNVRVLVAATIDFMEKYAQKKAEKKLMDFPDMEHMALDILYTEQDGERVPSETALMYRDYFEEIMIDEYQDSNLVQELLLMSMARTKDGERNCFMVGDVKQSIYKFRLARPEIFMEKYENFSDEGSRLRIDLHQNFRSRSEVLDTVNLIFERIMDASLGGVTYDEAARLNLGASYEDNPHCQSELLLYEETDGEQESEITGREGEAQMVAQRIRQLVGHMDITDEERGGMRKVRYGDIVILLRSAGSYGPDYKKALEKRGIPVYIPVSTGYFAATEIRQLLDYLKVLDNPYHDIPLCGLLKSPFFDFTDEELALVKGSLGEQEQKLPYYETMKRFVIFDKEATEGAQKAAEEQQEADITPDSSGYAAAAPRTGALEGSLPQLCRKVQATLDRIAENRRKAVYLSVYELLLELMRQSNYMEYESALPAGGQRRANLEMLLQKASDFEQTSYHGLFDFVRYMNQLEKYEVDFGEAGIVDEHMDAVRIMTIHKSKGLEFPVCFVCGLAKRYNMTSAYDAVLTDMELGIAVDYMDPERRMKAPTICKRFVSDKMKKDSIGEELRVLYVALTRAKEKLIMTGNVTRLESAVKPYEGLRDGLLPYALRSSAGSSLTLVLAAFCSAGQLDEICRLVHEADVLQTDLEQGTGRELRKEILLGELQREGGGRLYQTLSERFAYEYPYQMLSRLYTKTSVSELKKAAMEADEDVHVIFETDDHTSAYLPKYMRDGQESGGANRGSAYHKVLELIAYEKYAECYEESDEKSAAESQTGTMSDVWVLSEEEKDEGQLERQIDADIQRFVENGLLSEEYRELVKPRQIARFLQSESARRMGWAAKRGKLFKERPFVMQIPANLLGEEFPKEEGVLIQGIIDVYFEEDGELVVLDYKTDRVDDAGELVKRYQTQLDYYASALEQLVGQRVKEKIIYSFALHEEIFL